jgi:hypothetical protein
MIINYLKTVEETILEMSCAQQPVFDRSLHHVRFVVEKVALMWFPTTSVSPTSSHSTNCYISINRPIIDPI